MGVRSIVFAIGTCTLFSAQLVASRAGSEQQELKLVTPPLSMFRDQIRPPADALPVPAGFNRDQVVHGDRVFHGEAANGQCGVCHGVDGKGTANGNDLTAGMFIWSDGSVKELKRSILHNMAVAPGRDGDLEPADVDAVAAYVWAISRQEPAK
jgi:mono/diheme cytochrome c family protein